MPKGFYALMAAQFTSGLADNALMVLGVFFLQEQGYSGWWAPLLKFSFNLAYVVLASVVGPLADAFKKGSLMAAMNLLKLSSVLLLLLGLHPLLAFALSGLAAAVYAPAKYGMVTESVNASLLVKANAWLEVSVVMSVLLGIALGGWLTAISPSLAQGFDLRRSWPDWLSDTKVFPAFMVLVVIYGISIFLNGWIGRSMANTKVIALTRESMVWQNFWANNLTMWRDPLGSVSLYITTLFWGVGAVLQFAVLLWAEKHMGLSLQQGAYLQAVVAVGAICGAILAAKFFKIFNARAVLPWGFVLAVLMPALALTPSIGLAVLLLILAGLIAGLMLVPMNALLQQRGAKVLSSGRSIAVQGFNENLSVLIMLGIYSLLLAWDLTLKAIMFGFGLMLLIGLLLLFHRMKRSPKKG